MTQSIQYDAIIVGSGQAGTPLSRTLAKAGWKTALIEREHVSGTCINEGCTPTKTMVASARVAYLARRGADYGVQTGPISVDMAVVRQRKRDIVTSFRSGGERRLRNTEGLDLLMGEARFIGPKILEVHLNSGETRQLTADKIFIDTGARPAMPSLSGVDKVSTLNSTSIMELDVIPEHLLVIGGGYIGLEFGQMFRRFGSRVTVIQRSTRLLAREDDDVADEVAKIMREDGLEILLETTPLHVEQIASNQIRLAVRSPEGERDLTGSHLLVAAGRTPNTDWLQLAATGLEADKHGFLPTNERLETSVPGIYALGDVKGGPAFTHISYDDFRIIRTNLLENGNTTIHDRFVPYTVFIDPQLGHIGLSETEAKAQGRNIRIAKMPMNYVARALSTITQCFRHNQCSMASLYTKKVRCLYLEVGEARGFMKAIVDADTKQILGCTVLGIEGGEIMAMLEIAMMGKLPYTVLRDAIFAHPTLAEALNNLFSALDQ